MPHSLYQGILNSNHPADWGPEYINNFLNYVRENLKVTDDVLNQPTQPTVDDMIEEINSFDKNQKLTLLCLGPLTNIANIIRRHPLFLAERVERMVIMGGAVLVDGNAPGGGGGEYNFYLDPESAAFALKNCGIPIVMCGLEVASDTIISDEKYKQLLSLLLLENTNLSYDDADVALSDIGTQCDGITVQLALQKTDSHKYLLRETFTAKELIRSISSFSRDSLCYDTVVGYYLIHPESFIFTDISIVVDEVSGRTVEVSTDSVQSGAIDISLAISLRKDEFYNYLLCNIYK